MKVTFAPQQNNTMSFKGEIETKQLYDVASKINDAVKNSVNKIYDKANAEEYYKYSFSLSDATENFLKNNDEKDIPKASEIVEILENAIKGLNEIKDKTYNDTAEFLKRNLNVAKNTVKTIISTKNVFKTSKKTSQTANEALETINNSKEKKLEQSIKNLLNPPEEASKTVFEAKSKLADFISEKRNDKDPLFKNINEAANQFFGDSERPQLNSLDSLEFLQDPKFAEKSFSEEEMYNCANLRLTMNEYLKAKKPEIAKEKAEELIKNYSNTAEAFANSRKFNLASEAHENALSAFKLLHAMEDSPEGIKKILKKDDDLKYEFNKLLNNLRDSYLEQIHISTDSGEKKDLVQKIQELGKYE